MTFFIRSTKTKGGRRKTSFRVKIKIPQSRKPYEYRDKILFGMGFGSYRGYLKSKLWKAIRDEKLRQVPVCELCDKTSCCVHHMDYDRLTMIGQQMHRLVSLCNWCHEILEFKRDGKKRAYHDVMDLTKQRLKERGRMQEHRG